jgi:DNA-binding CsgD family transcriptional regulator
MLRGLGAQVSEPPLLAATGLSSHELRVVEQVALGATTAEAAARLFVTPKTIEYHLGRVYRKLGIRSRAQLATAL